MAHNEQFIAYTKKKTFDSELANGDIKASSLVFVEEEGKEILHTQDKTYNFVPSGGTEGLVLVKTKDGSIQWGGAVGMLEDMLAYGVEWKDNVPDPHLTRIGNMKLHKTLPIQSQLKGCIAQGNKIMYWLDPNDWRFAQDKNDPKRIGYIKLADLSNPRVLKNVDNSTYSKIRLGLYIKAFTNNTSNGIAFIGKITNIEDDPDDTTMAKVSIDWEVTPPDGTFEDNDRGQTKVEIGSNLDGFDGTVRVYCPSFYIKSQIIGDTRRVLLSTVKIDDTWTYQPEILIDAYRSTVLNTVPENMGYLSSLPVNSAISVVNTATYCRGGSNRPTYDKYLEGVEASEGVEAVAKDIFRTDLGKPITNKSRYLMRTYSRAAGSEMLSYDQYKNIFYWLYVVEYANFNCLEAYNEALTDNGYHQGGLGNGVTGVSSNTLDYNTITPCGYGNDLGNGTGVKLITSLELKPVNEIYMCRWRGFDNPFGDIYTNLDGIIIDADASNHSVHKKYVYTCQDSTKFSDTLTEDYKKVGNEDTIDGYIKLFDLGDAAHIIPDVVSRVDFSQSYKCDYHPADSGDKPLIRTLRVGGSMRDRAYAGLGCFNSRTQVSSSISYTGFRTVSLL